MSRCRTRTATPLSQQTGKDTSRRKRKLALVSFAFLVHTVGIFCPVHLSSYTCCILPGDIHYLEMNSPNLDILFFFLKVSGSIDGIILCKSLQLKGRLQQKCEITHDTEWVTLTPGFFLLAQLFAIYLTESLHHNLTTICVTFILMKKFYSHYYYSI